MIRFRVALLAFFTALLCSFAFAQNSSGTTLIKTDAGVLWVQNDDVHFTLEIKGKEITPLQEYPYLSVDRRPVQIRIVAIKDFHRGALKSPLNDSAILQRHKEWETEHLGKIAGVTLETQSEPLKLKREALFWSFPTPKALKAQSTNQVFLTTVVGKYVLALIGATTAGETVTEARGFFLEMISTLQTSGKPIDVEALQESIRKGGPSEIAKLRVLFIGNSYTYFNNLPRIVAGLAEGSKQPIETEMIAIGGATLKRMWEEGKALDTIQKGKWDFVVLQEQSTLGPAPMVDGKVQISDPKVFREYARLFDAEIKKASARTVFYLTWSRLNAPETQAALTAAYQNIAKELNAIVVPAGLAWETALKRNPQLALHVADKSHPSPMGSYLAACVFYAALTGKNPEGLPGRILGPRVETSGKLKEDANAELVNLTAAETSLLQRIAWETVKP